MKQRTYPSLYQVNTRVWLTQVSEKLGRRATLDDLSDSDLDHLAKMGFEWIWFLSVWSTGDQGRSISIKNEIFRRDFEETLPDLREEDIGGSGFAIAEYKVRPDLGGNESLERLRGRLKKRGLKLMLDFVPNHMGPDHPWVKEHPEYFVHGGPSDLEKFPQNYSRIQNPGGETILAYGRDPYFDGWPDTFQLDYSNPSTVEAMKSELLRISTQCDGVRCDMAMLILPEIFERTWGRRAESFWPGVTQAVREINPEFLFMAEVYWDMEWTMQQQGFDYAYDKRLYDRLRDGHARDVRGHFRASLDYQDKLARFLENHDEPRAAATFEKPNHEAAAILTFFSPGLRFFHQGQFEGRRKRISPHLVRAPYEPLDEGLKKFYDSLLAILKNQLFHDGGWDLWDCLPAWEGNGSWDAFIVFGWEGIGGARAMVAVNYSPHQSQCYVHLPFLDFGNVTVQFNDLTSAAQYERAGAELLPRGMYLDMPPWGYHVFNVTTQKKSQP